MYMAAVKEGCVHVCLWNSMHVAISLGCLVSLLQVCGQVEIKTYENRVTTYRRPSVSSSFALMK